MLQLVPNSRTATLKALPVERDANMNSNCDADEVGLREVLLQLASHVAETDGGDQDGPAGLAQAISERVSASLIDEECDHAGVDVAAIEA